MGIYIKLNSAKTLDIYDNGYILGRAIPANVGTARLYINNSNSEYSFGFTSNSSASQYSPAFKINGKDCYIARAEAYTSSRSSQYISGYGTKQEVDYYGTASRSSISGYGTKQEVDHYGTGSRSSISGYGTKQEVDHYGTASRSSISGYGTASRSSISAYSTRAYYKYGSNSTYAGYIHNIVTLGKISSNGGEFYTYSFKVKATYENNTLYNNTFYARTMISATAEAQNDSYGGLFSGGCVTSHVPTSTKMFFGVSANYNNTAERKYLSYVSSEGKLFHVIYCDEDAYDTTQVARSIGMTMTTRTVQEAQTRSSQYTSATYTRSSQYTSNTYYKTVTTATYTRSSQYTSNTYYKTVTTATYTRSSQYISNTYYKTVTSATYTASRSSQYNTSSHNVNM